MTSMQRIGLVAMRELRERGKSKAYLISTVITILILGAVIVLPSVLGGDAETYRIGLVGSGGEELVEVAGQIAAQEADEDAEPDTFETVPFDTVDAAETQLEEGEIDLVLVEGEKIVVSGFGGFGGPAGEGVARILQEAASTSRLQELLAENDAAAEVVEILGSQPLETRNLAGDGDGSDPNLRGGIAFGGLVLMYIAVLTYGSWMLSGVTEEKTNRVVEVLLSTLKPWEIFAGKLAGIGLLGLGQMTILVSVGLVALRVQSDIDLPDLPLDSMAALIGWFAIGFLLYATLFGAAGALVSRMEDAQNAAAPLSVLAVAGYFFAFIALNDPGGVAARIGTFIPFTAPYVAPIRLALREIAAWEMALAVVISIAAVFVMIRLAGRVYAGGLLRFGSRVKWREAFKARE